MTFDLRFWRPFVYASAALLLVFGITTMREPGRGFTKIIHFGTSFAGQQLPVVKRLRVALTPGAGYDGQFYAQLAVTPNVQSPEVRVAMDDLRYRGQRILLPVIAHVLGAGDPWWILQIYALLNVVCWAVLAWLLHGLTASRGYAGLLCWVVVMFSLAVLENVHLALTDLPAALSIVAALVCLQRDWLWRAGCFLSLAGLVRETSLLAALALMPVAWRDFAIWRKRIGPLLLAILPVCFWYLYLRLCTPATGPLGGVANFDWPGLALLHELNVCAQAIIQGEAHYRHIFAPLAAAGFAYQSFAILRTSVTAPTTWALMGAPFAVLFWFLGENVWEGYWAVARACLPMTIAYCLIIPSDRYFIWRLLLPNLCLVHAIQRFLSPATQ